MKLEFEFLGVHCEVCNDPMGYTLNCPVCKSTEYAEIYGYMIEHFEDEDDFKCGKCSTKFRPKSKVGGYDEWEFDIV